MSNHKNSFLFNGFEADLSAELLCKDGAIADLPPQALKLLFFLIENRHRVVLRDEIASLLWPEDAADPTHRLNSAIRLLRRGLGEVNSDLSVIRTYPKKGYRFFPQAESNGVPNKLRFIVKTPKAFCIVGLLTVVFLSMTIGWSFIEVEKREVQPSLVLMGVKNLCTSTSNDGFDRSFYSQLLNKMNSVGKNHDLELIKMSDLAGAEEPREVAPNARFALQSMSRHGANGKFRSFTITLSSVKDNVVLWSKSYEASESEELFHAKRLAEQIVSDIELYLVEHL